MQKQNELSSQKMNPPMVHKISECFVKPKYSPEESKQPLYLTPWDLAMLSVQYMQRGLLFAKPPEAKSQENFMSNLLNKLKHSLSIALVHFYPLAGRFVTVKSENPPSYLIYVDCNKGPGAKFIYANINMSVSDIVSSVDVPVSVQSFFDHNEAVNHDGHTMSLVSIQVTELVDGIFIGCSMTHAIADGTSYWNFFNTWSEIFKEKENTSSISRPPIFKPWFPDGHSPIINLPFTHHDEFIKKYEPPVIRDRIFHFSSKSIAKLKAKANAESNTNKISSMQSLSAFVWRCVTRARNLPSDQITSCRLTANNRTRLNPPLSQDYFGNIIYPLRVDATAGELVGHGFEWAAWKLNQAVGNHSDKAIREWYEAWVKSPAIYQLSQFDSSSVMIGNSPRFNMYGSEFGMGKALVVLSGYTNRFDGRIWALQGRDGDGSIDFEVCISPKAMHALECDEEFMKVAFPTY